LFVLCSYVSAAYTFDPDACLHIFLTFIILKDIGHTKHKVRTVHHTELIFVMPKNLSVPLPDIFAERANTYLLMYAHWSTKDGSVHQTDSNSTRHPLRHTRNHTCSLSRNSMANPDPEMRSSRTAENVFFYTPAPSFLQERKSQ